MKIANNPLNPKQDDEEEKENEGVDKDEEEENAIIYRPKAKR